MEESQSIIQLYEVPSFQPMQCWTIYSDSDDVCLLRRIRWDFAVDYHQIKKVQPTTYGADAGIDAGLVLSRVDKLAQLSLPIFNLSRSIGIDGVSYGLRKKGFSGFAEFAWWCEPPSGCEEIAEWYHEFVDVLESHLPQTSSR